MNYEDSLVIPNVEDLLDSIYSLSDMSDVCRIDRAVAMDVLEQNKVDGVLNVPKEYGMFICE